VIPRYPYGTIWVLWSNDGVVMLSISLGDHEIVPEPGTVRSVRSGEPADLNNPLHYPIEAICIACGQPIRTERWLLAEWRHIAPEP
jgi:hypothetical protein